MADQSPQPPDLMAAFKAASQVAKAVPSLAPSRRPPESGLLLLASAAGSIVAAVVPAHPSAVGVLAGAIVTGLVALGRHR